MIWYVIHNFNVFFKTSNILCLQVASYKQQSRQEEQRRRALDLHLNFIVGQTEKYSSWLAEGMKESAATSPMSSGKTLNSFFLVLKI